MLNFLVLLVLPVAGCRERCDEQIVQTVTSPNGFLKADAIVRNCGATTPYVFEVRIVSTAEAGAEKTILYRGSNSSSGKINWDGDKKLIIETDSETVILMKTYFGVDIEMTKK